MYSSLDDIYIYIAFQKSTGFRSGRGRWKCAVYRIIRNGGGLILERRGWERERGRWRGRGRGNRGRGNLWEKEGVRVGLKGRREVCEEWVGD